MNFRKSLFSNLLSDYEVLEPPVGRCIHSIVMVVVLPCQKRSDEKCDDQQDYIDLIDKLDIRLHE